MKKWTTTQDLVRSFSFRTGMQSDKISILNSIWEREAGALSKHWPLIGVKRGILFVKPKSAAAAQELRLRSPQIVSGLNKYFSRAWIKAVRPVV
jgi:hypothetical protein